MLPAVLAVFHCFRWYYFFRSGSERVMDNQGPGPRTTSPIDWLEDAVRSGRQLIGSQWFHFPGNVLGGDRAPVVRLLCVFEEYLDAQNAVWTQVVRDVFDLDVFWQDELLAQLASRHLGAGDAKQRVVLGDYFQHLTVDVHLCQDAPTESTSLMRKAHSGMCRRSTTLAWWLVHEYNNHSEIVGFLSRAYMFHSYHQHLLHHLYKPLARRLILNTNSHRPTGSGKLQVDAVCIISVFETVNWYVMTHNFWSRYGGCQT